MPQNTYSAYDDEDIRLRRKLIEFAPKLSRLNDIKDKLDRERTRFEQWLNKEYGSDMREAAQIEADLELLRDWFNSEVEQLFYSGKRYFFEKSVSPRPMTEVVYADEEEFLNWAKDFPEVYVVDKHAEPLKEVAKILFRERRIDLLTVDTAKAEKIAGTVYDDGSPIYQGPFEVKRTTSKTSRDKLVALITTFGYENEHDKRSNPGKESVDGSET